MRSLFGIGTPRGLQAFADLALALYLAILTLLWRHKARTSRTTPPAAEPDMLLALA
ncbi:MAG: hypothetical protein WD872_12020 [Pirellulaceae bacterium]